MKNAPSEAAAPVASHLIRSYYLRASDGTDWTGAEGVFCFNHFKERS